MRVPGDFTTGEREPPTIVSFVRAIVLLCLLPLKGGHEHFSNTDLCQLGALFHKIRASFKGWMILRVTFHTEKVSPHTLFALQWLVRVRGVLPGDPETVNPQPS